MPKKYVVHRARSEFGNYKDEYEVKYLMVDPGDAARAARFDYKA